MYFLPKIHKIDPDLIKKTFKEGFSQTEIQIPMRPIINKCSSPTRRIEKFLDLIFKPLLRKESFYIQDTKDFITRIESLELKDDCILVAYDVTSMYTNMRITDLQKTLTRNLANINRDSFNFRIPNTEVLEKMIKLTLENNKFEFNGQLYKQVIGAPMGGILSSTCTDLHLATLLKIILVHREH